MTFAEMDMMTLWELEKLKDQLRGRVTTLNGKVQKRKAYLKAARYPGCEPNYKTDEELIQLKIDLVEASNDLSRYKEYMTIRKCRINSEKAREELELQKVALEKARFEAENKDFINERDAKADARRPGGPNVWFGPEFNNIKGAEKRLVVMMAREIGQDRYNELRRIAYWDTRRGNNRYYTGTDQWNDRKGLF